MEINDDISQLEEILAGNDYEERTVFIDEILQEFAYLNDEEIELIDKVLYNEKTYDKKCPICLTEHIDGELLVSLRCPCKKERLCQSCAFKAMKEKSQCPCCRAYV